MQTDHAYQNASAWMDTILDYQRALDPETWERLGELETALQDEADNLSDFRKAEAIDLALTKEEQSELVELRKLRDEYQDEEHAEEMAKESPLSIELSGTWTPGETPIADGFVILLSTGGPALRIVGELGQYNEPNRAWLEYRDWGTAWTEYYGENSDQDAILAFCSVFYFGE